MNFDNAEDFILDAGPRTDFFIDGHSGERIGNAKTRLSEIRGDFTITVRTEPSFHSTYDAGAIFAYGDDNHWIKIAFELTDLGYTSVVSVVTDESSDDCNGEQIGAKSIWLRLVRKAKFWSAHFSYDCKTWKMTRYFPLDLPEVIQIGVIAQSPTGEGCSVKFSGLGIKKGSVENLRRGE